MNPRMENISHESIARASYARVKPDFDTLRPDELAPINIDVGETVSTIVGVLPEVRALRPKIAEELPKFDLASFDKLEDYAWALSHAHTRFLTATQPPDDLQAVVAEASKLRERLLADARSLAGYGLVDEGRLARMQGARGYKNIAQDLQILGHVLQESWEQIEGKAPTTAEDLEDAMRLSSRLTRIVGLREQGPAQRAEATDTRVRAFTLAVRVYEQARRAVGYLRAEYGDSDSIAPSLYQGKGRRKSSDETEGHTDEPTSGVDPGGTVPPSGAGTSETSVNPNARVASSINGPFMS